MHAYVLYIIVYDYDPNYGYLLYSKSLINEFPVRTNVVHSYHLPSSFPHVACHLPT